MIVSTKVIKALAGFASNDPLRSALGGILFDPKDKSFNIVATDGHILLRTNALTKYDDDQSYPGWEGETWMPTEPLHIGAEIFDIAKAVKKSKTYDSGNEILITGFNSAGKLNVVYNITHVASIPLIDANYPDVQAIIPKDDINYKQYISRIFEVDNLLTVLKACKDMGDKFIKFKLLLDNSVTLVTNHSQNENQNYEILVTNADSVENSNAPKIRRNLILQYSHSALGSCVHSEFTTDEDAGIFSATSAVNYIHDKLYPRICKEFYNGLPCYFIYRLTTEVNSKFNGDEIYYSTSVNPMLDINNVEEELSAAEMNAINELMDGPGASDSAIVQQNACMQAVEELNKLSAKCSICGFEYTNDEHNTLIQKNMSTDEYICINCAAAEIDNQKLIDDTDKEITDPNPAFTEALIEGTSTKAINERMFKEYTELRHKYEDYIVLMKQDDSIFTFYPGFKELVIRHAQINTVDTVVGIDDKVFVRHEYKSFDLEKTISALVNQGFRVLVAEGVDKITTAEPDMFPNTGKKWTREDEEKLEFLYKAGKTIEDLAEIFGRKDKGIISRLDKLGLIEQVQETKPAPAEQPRETIIVEGYLSTSSYIGKDRAKTKFKVTGRHPTTSGNTDVKPWLKLAEAYGIDITDEVIVYKESDPDNNIFYINRKSVFVPDEEIKTESTAVQWTAEDSEYMLQYYKEGTSIEELSEAMGQSVEFIIDKLTALGAIKKESAVPSGFIPIKHPIYCRVGKKVIDNAGKVHLIKAVNVGKGIINENNISISFDNLTHVSEK